MTGISTALVHCAHHFPTHCGDADVKMYCKNSNCKVNTFRSDVCSLKKYNWVLSLSMSRYFIESCNQCSYDFFDIYMTLGCRRYFYLVIVFTRMPYPYKICTCLYFVLICLGYITTSYWCLYGLFHRNWDNRVIGPVPVTLPWQIWIKLTGIPTNSFLTVTPTKKVIMWFIIIIFGLTLLNQYDK